MMATISKSPRTREEMVEALRRHVRLLETYSEQAFRHRNFDYAGEVAGKLRLLAVKFRSNEPLLLRLMEEYGADVRFKLFLPPVEFPPEQAWIKEPITLEQYLGLDAMGLRIPSGELVTLTNMQFIRAWAEQAGAPHEDWEMDEALRATLSAPIFIQNTQEAVYILAGITQTVLSVAHKFLRILDEAA